MLRYALIFQVVVLFLLIGCGTSNGGKEDGGDSVTKGTDSELDTDVENDTARIQDTTPNDDIDSTTAHDSALVDDGEGLQAGQLIWAQRAGGHFVDNGHGDQGQALSVMANGDVYVAGEVYSNNPVFNPGGANETTIPMENVDHRFDVFLARYHQDGSLSFVRTAGGGKWDFASDVAALGNGAAVFVGNVRSSNVVFGEGEPNETTFAAENSMFIARYEQNGSLDWVQTNQGGHAAADTVVHTPDGRVCVAGSVKPPADGSCILGAGSPNEVDVAQTSRADQFVGCYTVEGELEWVRLHEELGYCLVNTMAASDDNTLWVGGMTGRGVVYNLGQPDESQTATDADSPMDLGTIAHHGADGALLHHLYITDAAIDFVVGTSDNGLVAGGYYGNDGVGSHIVDSTQLITPLPTPGDQGGLLLRLGANGEIVWTTTIDGATGRKQVNGGAVTENGSILVTGNYQDSATFGAGQPGETTITAPNELGQGSFVAQYNANGQLDWVVALGKDGFHYATDIAATPYGFYVTGTFKSTAFVLGAGEPNETILSTDGTKDIFLAKFAL